MKKIQKNSPLGRRTYWSTAQKSLQLAAVALVLGGFSASAASTANGEGSNETATIISQQQERTIKGRIIDANDNSALIGANVVVKGTTIGTITDIDGNFSLQVPAGTETVQVSFIGYVAQDIAIADQEEIFVKLAPDTENIEEVVVTALGIKREKKALGYAVTEVKGDEIAESSTVSPVTALQGKVAGVDIAPSDGGTFGSTRVTIRGNSTLGTNNQPIYVIDGVVLDNETSGGSEWGGSDWGNELKNLNPDDFESVTVLKGSAATALYGSRALNGAIVITSKKGKAHKGIGVNISQTVNVKSVYDGPAFQNVYGEGAPPGYDSDHEDTFYPQGSFPKNGDGDPYLKGDWVPISYGHKMDGSKVIDWNGEWISYDPQPDNYKQAFETGLFSNTNISLDGGNEKTTFRLSYSYTDEEGYYPNNNFTRNAIATTVTHKITDFLRADVNVSYAASDLMNPPSGGLQQAFVTGNFPRNYNTNKWKNQYKAAHGGVPNKDYKDPNWQVPSHGLWFDIYENETTRLEESLRMTGKLHIDVTDWFNVILEGNMNNFYMTEEEKKLGMGYGNKGGDANQGGKYLLGHTRKEQNSFKAFASINREISEDWTTNFSLGGETWQSETTSNRSWTDGGLTIPGQFTLTNSNLKAKTEAKISDQRILNSAYFIGELTWRNQVFLTVTGRNDWSSTLTYMDGTGTNSYFYPSVSGSWIFTESFEMPSWLNFGKIRASFAEVGSDFKPYQINTGFSKIRTLESPNGDIPSYTYYGENESDSQRWRVPNGGLKPERKRSYELGLDLNMLDNRLGVDLTLYKENTTNQIMSLGVPVESGVSSQLINAGNIQNQGIELTLRTTPYKKGDWQWDVDFTYTKNENKIIELADGVEQYILEGSPSYGNTRVASAAMIGGEYGLLISDSAPIRYQNDKNANDPKNGLPILKWNTSQRGAYQLRNGKEEVVGNMMADWTGSLATSVSYKNFSIRALFDIKMGGDIVSYSNRYGMCYGILENSLDYRDNEHGGFDWSSTWTGESYEDGYIPEGVFEDGTTVKMKDAAGKEVSYDVSGMSYREAYEAGMVDPVHGSYWHWKNNSWGLGLANENLVLESSYVGVREIVANYSVPRHITDKLHLHSLDISLFGRDLGFLYNSLPNNLNPFSIKSNRSGACMEWGLSPFVSTYGFTLKLGI